VSSLKPSPVRTWPRYARAAIAPVFVLVVLFAALWLLRQQLHDYHLRDFLDGLRSIPTRDLVWAVVLTIINYGILISYDALGLWYVRHPMSFGRVALASFLGYAVANNFGLLLGGSTIRYRLYSTWGLSAGQIFRLIFLLAVTFWVGLFGLSAVVFLVDPLEIPAAMHMPFRTTRPLGVVLLVVTAAYFLWCGWRRRPVRRGRYELSPPPLRLAAVQLGVSSIDLLVAAAILYVLLPDSLNITYGKFVAVYLLALVATFLTQVPGGLGVLELVVLTLLSPDQPERLVGSLLAYRLIYFLTPMMIGLLLLAAHEIALQRRRLAMAMGVLGRWTPDIAPKLVAASVFLAGTIMLVASATPLSAERIEWLAARLPLWLVEASHVCGAVAGMALLMLSRSLMRQLAAAYPWTVAVLASSIVLSIVRRAGIEEAIALAIVLAAVLPCRHYFFRPDRLFGDRLSARWLTAVTMVFLVSVWLMGFAYKDVDLDVRWWNYFAYDADGPRSIRAMAVAATALVSFTIVRLLAAPAPKILPPQIDRPRIRQIVGSSRFASAHLALAADKRVMLNETKTALVMYGVSGNTWIAMGDPVGPTDGGEQIAWDFFELCDSGGHWPVFYEVSKDRTPLYEEMGLAVVKISEEARVPLPSFHLHRGRHRELRRTEQALNQLGCRWEILQPPEIAHWMPTLKQAAAQWLAEKPVVERQFNTGQSQPSYWTEMPLVVVKRDDRIVAMTSLWLGAERQELAVDDIRYGTAAPDGVMEWLLAEIMLWGQANEYQWFSFGTVPLEAPEAQPLGPAYNRLAPLISRHGQHFFSTRGLRHFLDKFDPVWSTRSLAIPKRASLEVVLEDLTRLIAPPSG